MDKPGDILGLADMETPVKSVKLVTPIKPVDVIIYPNAYGPVDFEGPVDTIAQPHT